ncbi:hypothetical protein GINT2_001614 [Glugoides intestinalis]
MSFGPKFNSIHPFSQLKQQKAIAHQFVKIPFRTIPCTTVADDFYSEMIDWAGERIFYCENNKVFQYNFYSNTCIKIFDDQSTVICSIKAIRQSNILAIGSVSGTLIMLDLKTEKFTRSTIHRGRISTLDAMGNTIISGSRDRTVKLVDLRSIKAERSYQFHMQEVCGLSVNKDHRYLSTGGNDNKIFVLDLRKDENYYLKLEAHRAAVKALSWSPLHAMKFVSGGGTADKNVNIWDIQREKPLLQSVCFESQVCNLKWLRSNKILSTFGYSNDDIKLLDGLQIEKEFSGHKNRVIHFAVNDDEEFFVSGSGDSEIKIWKIEERENEIKLR